VGRVRVIFKLPTIIDVGLGKQSSPNYWPTNTPLTYIEWYQPLAKDPDSTNGMFVVKKQAQPTYSIIPVHSIRQSCMLIPRFEVEEKANDTSSLRNSGWKTENVLDSASSFFLNNWQSNYTYQTLW
jgi:hypothetical protein